jgi:hypothetical protein
MADQNKIAIELNRQKQAARTAQAGAEKSGNQAPGQDIKSSDPGYLRQNEAGNIDQRLAGEQMKNNVASVDSSMALNKEPEAEEAESEQDYDAEGEEAQMEGEEELALEQKQQMDRATFLAAIKQGRNTKMQKKLQDEAKQNKEEVGNNLSATTEGWLRMAWINLLDSFLTSILYVDLHWFMGKVLPNFFCKLGHEWVPQSIKKKSPKQAKVEGDKKSFVENAGCLLINCCCIFIILLPLLPILMIAWIFDSPGSAACAMASDIVSFFKSNFLTYIIGWTVEKIAALFCNIL